MVTVDDYIGKRDNTSRTAINIMTVSGTMVSASAGLTSYDYISVRNIGAAPINVFSTSSGTYGEGITVASGSTFSDSIRSPLYIKTAGSSTSVEVYQRKDPIVF